MVRPGIATREDYDRLPEDVRAELIRRELVMIPAPSPWHEHLVSSLLFALHDQLGSEARNRVLGSRSEVLIAEAAGESILQPDAVVLPEGTRPTGADWKIPTPVWVLEVLSPSTAQRDREVKLELYARKGIPEAWIVDPEAETIEVHDLAAGTRRVCARGAWAESAAVPGFRVDVQDLFAV